MSLRHLTSTSVLVAVALTSAGLAFSVTTSSAATLDDGLVLHHADPNDHVQLSDDVLGALVDATVSAQVGHIAGGLRTITFIHGNTRNLVVVGATNGVFATTTAQLGTWQAVGTNLPRAPVLDSQFNATRNQLAVGTLGRGIWTAAGLAQ